MNAVVCTRYGPPEVLQLGQVATPVPKDNEVLVKVCATAVTASDCIIRGFNVAFRFRIPMGLVLGFGKPRQPILGMVFAGEVESVGRAVSSFKPGDQVFGFDRFHFGAYAEYKCIPEKGLLAIKPANVTYEEAAAILYGGLLAQHFLRKTNLQSGQKVLIYGASGAVGTAAVQLARARGATVTGVCSAANFELVKSLGAQAVIDYTRDDATDKIELYDLVFDAAGRRKTSSFKSRCSKALTPSGKYVSVDDGSPKLPVEDLIALKELVEAGKIKPVIDRRYPLEQLAEAHRYVDGAHKRGNVVITVEHKT